MRDALSGSVGRGSGSGVLAPALLLLLLLPAALSQGAESCTAEVANSDKAATGSMTGATGDTVTVVCNVGYGPGGAATCETTGFSAVTCAANTCAATEVANSDKAATGSITGMTGEEVDVACNPGYSESSLWTISAGDCGGNDASPGGSNLGSVQACKGACNANDLCVGFLWNTNEGGECWLKTACDPNGDSNFDFYQKRSGGGIATCGAGGSFSVVTCHAAVLLNEVLPNPSGAGAAEWVELFNAGSTNVDLAGWTIENSACFSEPCVEPTAGQVSPILATV